MWPVELGQTRLLWRLWSESRHHLYRGRQAEALAQSELSVCLSMLSGLLLPSRPLSFELWPCLRPHHRLLRDVNLVQSMTCRLLWPKLLSRGILCSTRPHYRMAALSSSPCDQSPSWIVCVASMMNLGCHHLRAHDVAQYSLCLCVGHSRGQSGIVSLKWMRVSSAAGTT